MDGTDPMVATIASAAFLLLFGVVLALAGTRHYKTAAGVLLVVGVVMLGFAAYGTFGGAS